MKSIDMLRELREQGGKVRTQGLDDATIERFRSDSYALVPAWTCWITVRGSAS